MLRSLTVQGFGLIDLTSVDLEPGLNAFTGETGGGKSMVIDALGFVFGERAGADVVRSGADKATVFAEVQPNATALAWLKENALEAEDDALVLSREYAASGRSSARVNGKPVTAGQLRELADIMLDVVGQHEHQKLLQPAAHLDMLDAYAGEDALTKRDEVAALVTASRALARELHELRTSGDQSLRALEDARFAAAEIRDAKLEPGEMESLRERRSMLAHAAKIAQAVETAIDAIDDVDRGATAQLGRASSALGGISAYASSLRDFSDQAKGLQSAAQDLSFALAALREEGAFDPGQLDEVENRLALLERVLHKYGPSLEEAMTARERFEAQANKLENREAEIARLEGQQAHTDAELGAAAGALTRLRKDAAAKLAARVEAELQRLNMKGATFACVVEASSDITATGGDEVEFMAALNPKEPERAIAKSASGGELARLLLALKMAFAKVDPHPIVVLDEIDAGIGGAAARAVGERIAELAQGVQVLCVTHLAQIATFAQRHIVMEKATKQGRSVIAARGLDGKDEIRGEIARMLAGDAQSAEALRHAEALLKNK
ncbi:MAG: DNA repair protein RecN [Candidatus Eremiobacteraeota bacterium]|nr:DNA repair protein RecN [Candidatus Eremiobacteraeota bacterium]